MTTEARCPNPGCEKLYAITREMEGRKFRCDRCGAFFTVTFAAGHGRILVLDQPNDAAKPREPEEDEAPSSDPATGKPRIRRFEIKARIGRGSFGAVYRAYDPQLDRDVAIKRPRSAILANPKFKEAFLGEARAAAQLRHPHIVPIYDAGFDGTHYYIASAFVEGKTLAKAIDDDEISFDMAARIVKALADALAYAHDLGIVHRDVKPANVMIDKHGNPHLMDFGIAHRADAEDSLGEGAPLLGSPAYMSPEQARGKNAEVGPAADQYSLGVILFEMLCKTRPFTGTSSSIIYQKTHEDPPRPRSMNRDIPLDLDAICKKAISRLPEDRYPSCKELAEDLKRWLDGEPVIARPLSSAERFWRWCRRKPALAGTSAAAAALLVLVAVISVISAKRDREAKRVADALRQEAIRSAQKLEKQTIALEAAKKRAEAALAEKSKALDALRKAIEEKERSESMTEEMRKEKEKAEAMAREATLKNTIVEANALAKLYRYDEAIDLLAKVDFSSNAELEKTKNEMIKEYQEQMSALDSLSSERLNLLEIFTGKSQIDPKSYDLLLRIYLATDARLGPLLDACNFDAAIDLLDRYAEKPSHAALKRLFIAFQVELERLDFFISESKRKLAGMVGSDIRFRGLPAKVLKASEEGISLTVGGKERTIAWNDLRGLDFLRFFGKSGEHDTNMILAAGFLYFCDGDLLEAKKYFGRVAADHRNRFFKEITLLAWNAKCLKRIDALRQAFRTQDLMGMQRILDELDSVFEDTITVKMHSDLINRTRNLAQSLAAQKKEISNQIAEELLFDMQEKFRAEKDMLTRRYNREMDNLDRALSRVKRYKDNDWLRKRHGLKKADVRKMQQGVMNRIKALRSSYQRELRAREKVLKKTTDSLKTRLRIIQKQIAEGKKFSKQEIRKYLLGADQG